MRDIATGISDPGSQSCIIVAEVAQAHDGSLGMAHAYIDAVAAAGVDAVKFQTHIAEAESTPHEPWRVHFSEQDASRYEYWKRMEFTEEQWLGLKKHADDRDLIFLSSPFSVEAVEMLERIRMPAWKIASGQVDDEPMLEHIFSTGNPVIFSTGLSGLDEIEGLVERARSHGCPVALMQATTEYPCPPHKLGLSQILLMRQRFQCAVGLSDHSGEIYAGIAAAALGIDLLEVHVTFSKDMFGPDVAASITSGDLTRLVHGVRFAEQAVTPLDKNEAAAGLQDIRRIFAKSIVARRRLPAGTIIAEGDLAARKAGGGLQPALLDGLVGRKLGRDLEENEPLSEEDLEP